MAQVEETHKRERHGSDSVIEFNHYHPLEKKVKDIPASRGCGDHKPADVDTMEEEDASMATMDEVTCEGITKDMVKSPLNPNAKIFQMPSVSLSMSPIVPPLSPSVIPTVVDFPYHPFPNMIPGMIPVVTANGSLTRQKLIAREWYVSTYGRKLAKQIAEGKKTQRRLGLEFTVMNYNILAQNLIETNNYLYAHVRNRECLTWQHRSVRILMEIIEAQPDILCLQEVPEAHYTSFFAPRLVIEGYQGYYKKRHGDKLDGCATFIRGSTFEVTGVDKLDYFVSDYSLLDRDNVALITMLRPRIGKGRLAKEMREARICIANTHLLFNPKRGDVKLAQMMLLLSELEKISYKDKSILLNDNYHPIILCGDFNATPYSPLYEFVTKGRLKLNGLQAKSVSGQHEDQPCGSIREVPYPVLPVHLCITDDCQYSSVITFRKLRLDRRVARSISECEPSNIVPLSAIFQRTTSDYDQELIPEEPADFKSNERDDYSPIDDPSELAESEGAPSLRAKSSLSQTGDEERETTSNEPGLHDFPQLLLTNQSSEDSDVFLTAIETTEEIKNVKPRITYSRGELLKIGLLASCQLRPPTFDEFPQELKPVKDSRLSTSDRGYVFGDIIESEEEPVINHKFFFLSSYKHAVTSQDDHPEVSTHHSRTCESLDHVFYTGGQGSANTREHRETTLRLIGWLGFPTADQVISAGGLPNLHHCSDHLPAITRFGLTSEVQNIPRPFPKQPPGIASPAKVRTMTM